MEYDVNYSQHFMIWKKSLFASIFFYKLNIRQIDNIIDLTNVI